MIPTSRRGLILPSTWGPPFSRRMLGVREWDDVRPVPLWRLGSSVWNRPDASRRRGPLGARLRAPLQVEKGGANSGSGQGPIVR